MLEHTNNQLYILNGDISETALQKLRKNTTFVEDVIRGVDILSKYGDCSMTLMCDKYVSVTIENHIENNESVLADQHFVNYEDLDRLFELGWTNRITLEGDTIKELYWIYYLIEDLITPSDTLPESLETPNNLL